MESFKEFGELMSEIMFYIGNNKYEWMKCSYKLYMSDISLLFPQLDHQGNPDPFKDPIGSLAFSTRVEVDALNSMIYYFETIGDYKEANDLTEVKEKIKKSFRAMVNILRVSKPQLN